MSPKKGTLDVFKLFLRINNDKKTYNVTGKITEIRVIRFQLQYFWLELFRSCRKFLCSVFLGVLDKCLIYFRLSFYESFRKMLTE